MVGHLGRTSKEYWVMSFSAPETETMLPPIGRIPGDLFHQICSLARAAFLFRGVFVEAAEGKSITNIIDEREDALLLAERVLDAWSSHLGLEVDLVPLRPRSEG
jgi:hypothetical protein